MCATVACVSCVYENNNIRPIIVFFSARKRGGGGGDKRPIRRNLHVYTHARVRKLYIFRAHILCVGVGRYIICKYTYLFVGTTRFQSRARSNV